MDEETLALDLTKEDSEILTLILKSFREGMLPALNKALSDQNTEEVGAIQYMIYKAEELERETLEICKEFQKEPKSPIIIPKPQWD